MIIAACILLAAGTLFYTFNLGRQIAPPAEKTRLMYLAERKEVVYENLSDLNFDYKAGKLPELDHQRLRAGLEEEAAGILAEIEALARAEKFARNPSPGKYNP